MGMMLSTVKHYYDLAMTAIIRPPRQRVDENVFLGARHFDVTNDRGENIRCTWWRPDAGPTTRCLVFLHGNSSSRGAVLQILAHAVISGISVLAFDFSGSGESEGDYVSLGFFETDDLRAVIRHMREFTEVTQFALWGHSMGAVVALRYIHGDPSVVAAVCDSPFHDLRRLASDISGVHPWLLWPCVQVVRAGVRRRARFDILDVNPGGLVAETHVPVSFIHGERDELIPPAHSIDLHDKYAGDKHITIFDGDHNSPRPTEIIRRNMDFIVRGFNDATQGDLDDIQRGGRRDVGGIRTLETTNPLKRTRDQVAEIGAGPRKRLTVRDEETKMTQGDVAGLEPKTTRDHADEPLRATARRGVDREQTAADRETIMITETAQDF